MAVVLRRHVTRCPPWMHTCSLARWYSQSSVGESVETWTEGRVRVVAINRPQQRNAVNRHTAGLLFEAFEKFNSSNSELVAVLFGKGGNFCAGYDLKELAAAKHDGDIAKSQHKENIHAPMGPTHMTISKPVVAAVSGYAVAGGLELALMCDLRVVEENATFGVFSRRFGVPLIDGGTVRLPALVGISRALDMILTGRPVYAKEALEIGLANRVVEEGKSLEESLTLAHQLAEFPQNCLRADRNSALRSSTADQFEKLLKLEFEEGMKVIREESIKGAQRFAQGKGRGGTFE